MTSPPTLAIALTVASTATGGYSLARWAALRSGVAGHPGDPVAELSHLVMSVAMVAMAWGWTGPVANIGQLAVFGVLALYFAVRFGRGRRVTRHPVDGRATGAACPAPGFHLFLCLAMVWMVAAMPWLMGGGNGSGGQHGGHGPMPGMDMGGSDPGAGGASGPGGAPTWLSGLNVLVAAGLLGAAGYWLWRSGRPAGTGAGPAAAAGFRVPGTGPAVDPGHGEGDGRVVPPGTVAGRSSSVAVGTEVERPAPGGTGPTPRTDAVCHLVMSVAMAVMVLDMR